MLVNAEGLTKIYARGGEKIAALQRVDLQIAAGSFVFIVGPSGGGKSTLLHLLGGMDQPSSGKLTVNGIALDHASEDELTRFRRQHIGFVFQFFNLLPSLDALHNVALPLLASGYKLKEARQKAMALLRLVDLEARLQHKPAELSGGEQQRVAIARAVVGNPSLVLADEPTGDLDAVNAEAVMQLMLALNRSLGVTFVIATHNQALTRLGDKVYQLHTGQLRDDHC
ncbi:MAG: ABC transporter ATP-binding protein [Anaerolineales bacterium]|nr:ABC transporter ATP-binding protein [Anaerolineales bacterium]